MLLKDCVSVIRFSNIMKCEKLMEEIKSCGGKCANLCRVYKLIMISRVAGYGHLEYLCNAPDSMRQMSASYSPSLPCHLLACCILSCHHVHLILHTCSSHASEHFPRCPFCNPALLCPPVFPFLSPDVSGY